MTHVRRRRAHFASPLLLLVVVAAAVAIATTTTGGGGGGGGAEAFSAPPPPLRPRPSARATTPPSAAGSASSSSAAIRRSPPATTASRFPRRRNRGGGGTGSAEPALSLPRGGGAAAASSSGLAAKISDVLSTPPGYFNAALAALATCAALFKLSESDGAASPPSPSSETAAKNAIPASVTSLRRRFLSVFWLLRCADWLQGPYFYEVYASKTFGGVPASLGLISKLFLTGFASTALFGPIVGRLSDSHGRKRGTLAFALLYSLGAASTRSNALAVLLAGRVVSGIGTSLLFSAPEAWLVGESQRGGDDPDGSRLGETFGLAYAGDSVVAILAGQLAGVAASTRGPTGPFELSVGFLAFGAVLTSLLWGENRAERRAANASSDAEGGGGGEPTIREAIDVVRSDPKIALVGGVQSLFEAAMYVFVLQWPPAVSAAVSKAFGHDASTPYGAVFSCFMACCLLGSTLFGRLAKKADSGVNVETSTLAMLATSTVAMGFAALASSSSSSSVLSSSLGALVASFFVFESCVGIYFPSIGTLRSRYVPDSHRSVVMNLFGIPLNVLVVSVFLSIKRLGVTGALGVSAGALGLATVCMAKLRSIVAKGKEEDADAVAVASA